MSVLDFDINLHLRSRLTWLTFALVALIGLADFWLGTSFSLEVFYFIPVALAVIARGRTFGSLIAIACVFIWVGGDLAAGARYASWLVPVWNGAITLTIYLVLIWLLASLLDMKHDLERRVQQRTEALANESAERERLESNILEISERERRNIGHDLHDGLGQHLTGTAITAQLLAEKLRERAAAETEDAVKIVGLVKIAITQTRTMAKGLLLADIDHDGLASALFGFCGATSAEHRTHCHFHNDSPEVHPAPGVANHLFRIAQEAVRNAIRHGAAKQVDVTLQADASRLTLLIRDNGTGLPPVRLRGDGLGLRIMAHRARMIGASLTIERHPEGGTLVQCNLPVLSHV